MWEGLVRFAAMPGWLAALDDPARVEAALVPLVPGLRSAEVGGVRLKSARWTARCTLAVAGQEHTARLQATIVPPGHGAPGSVAAPTVAFGADGWRCWVPELRVELAMEAPPEAGLPALALLTDPLRARGLLEEAIRTGAPAYRDLRIRSCTPRVMRYSPGSRCTVLYQLELADESAAAGWPQVVVAKTYHRGDKGRTAWQGMQALWRTPLATSGTVAIAEPLAWLPELNILVQGPIRQERTLKQLLIDTLADANAAGDGAQAARAAEELRGYLAKTAAGLVELHRCGAPSTQRVTWHDELDEARQVLDRLTERLPALDGAADPFLQEAERLSARVPADPAVPAHRSFRPAQVLLNHGQIGFIDFDGFCHAEPALDVALFCATVRDLAMGVLPPDTPLRARLARVDELCEEFLACYQALAPISRERVALWEALDLFTNVLHSWTKVTPARLAHAVALLRHHTATLAALTRV